MIDKGFKSTVSKEAINALENRLTTRLNSIENLLMEEPKRKIEDLEKHMKRPEDALADLPDKKSRQAMAACGRPNPWR
jgi:predicted trehalose synthase